MSSAQSCGWLHSLVRSAAIVLATRVVLLAVMLAAMGLSSQIRGTPAADTVEVSENLLLATLRQAAFANDAGWYSSIARNGYDQRPFDTTRQANWAFFPAWPMLWKSASLLTGELLWSGLLLANFLFVLAMGVLHRLACQYFHGSVRHGDTAVLFACLAPASYFFSLPHTESLFLLLVLLAFLRMSAGSALQAALFGALASAARFNGLFLLPGLALHGPQREWLRPQRAWLLLVPAGAAAFATYLYVATGNPLAFSDIQVAWGRNPGSPIEPIAEYLEQPRLIIAPWSPRILHLCSGLVALAAVAWCIARRHWGFAAFVLLTLVAPLSTGTLMSLTRYLVVAFPVYLMLADLTLRWPTAGMLLLGLSGLTLGTLSVGFQLGLTVAGA